MTLNDFRNETDLIKAARKLQNNKTYQTMLEVARTELPSNRALPAMGASETDFAYAYGAEVGYRQCLAVLEAMAMEPQHSADELEATFGEATND